MASFAVELPDFSADPLWTSLSHNATLMFFLVDAATGEHLARLVRPARYFPQRLAEGRSQLSGGDSVCRPVAGAVKAFTKYRHEAVA